MKTIKEEGLPVKLWLDDIEPGAMEQVRNLARLPFAFKHIAIMPDAHQGYGMPIGGVIATEGVVVPNAVGVDIGCGMCAAKTTVRHGDATADRLKKVMGEIRRTVPVGFAHHKNKQGMMPTPSLPMKIVDEEFERAQTQIGTLGGGNHFIELQHDAKDNVWVMIHSGSRNIGFKAANHYNRIAVEMNKRWRSSVPKEWELAFLPLDSEEGQTYLSEMEYCVEFAFANRMLMMNRVLDALLGEFGGTSSGMINIAHNYAAMEHHFGKDVMVHRKGATLARDGTTGIIPGSQGTKSYIVRGRGNPDSFESCSHGAGRRMGRKEAERKLDLKAEQDRLDSQGVIHSVRTVHDLDEAAGAYKDIDVVMANQDDLVEIVEELTPIAVVKG